MHYSAQTNTIMHTGDWSNQGEGLIVQNQEAMKPDNYTEVETLVVVTKEETPYVMKKRGRKGNAAYDGFAIDLLKVLYLPYLCKVVFERGDNHGWEFLFSEKPKKIQNCRLDNLGVELEVLVT